VLVVDGDLTDLTGIALHDETGLGDRAVVLKRHEVM
jgi:hypothetical protein